MGNQQAQLADNYRHSGHLPPGTAASAGPNHEPLESYIKEKQRDEHLKNLGFKRSKSLRKSISKRLKRKKKGRDEADGSGGGGGSAADTDQPPPSSSEDPNSIETVTADPAGGGKTDNSSSSVDNKKAERNKPSSTVERLDVYPEPQRRPRPLVGEPQPLPSHVQVGELVNSKRDHRSDCTCR